MADAESRWDPTTKAQLTRLDQLENQARRRWSEWISSVVDLTAPWVLNPQSHAQIVGATLPSPGALSRLMLEQDRYMLMTGMAHADYEVGRLRARYASRQLANLADVENSFRVIPVEAMEALQARDLIIAGDVEADVLTALKRIALLNLAGDLRRRDAESEVMAVVDTTAARARNIVTTNGTYAYNHGRLSQFKELDVGHVLFRAVMDLKTSKQCKTRHGKIMATNDPQLPRNTPPLHGH